MIKALISDFSRVILFPKDESYVSGLNSLHKELSKQSQYNILDHFKLNMELLDFYQALKAKVRFFIFTSETIQDASEFQPYLQPIFEKVFSAGKMGVSKQDAETYTKLAVEIGLQPHEILFVDDISSNVKAAKQAGMQTVQFENNKKVVDKISVLIST